MIVFELKCGAEHTFEAWFQDSKAYERQSKRKQIACPVCGDCEVDKALMAPSVARSRESRAADERAMARAALQQLAALRKHVEQHCDYVGPNFAEEARKIHYGEVEKRDIYGEATANEAEALAEEGVEFARVPWAPRLDN
jgi:hypothetical protein